MLFFFIQGERSDVCRYLQADMLPFYRWHKFKTVSK